MFMCVRESEKDIKSPRNRQKKRERKRERELDRWIDR